MGTFYLLGMPCGPDSLEPLSSRFQHICGRAGIRAFSFLFFFTNLEMPKPSFAWHVFTCPAGKLKMSATCACWKAVAT